MGPSKLEENFFVILIGSHLSLDAMYARRVTPSYTGVDLMRDNNEEGGEKK
jgi:hypothetical protein